MRVVVAPNSFKGSLAAGDAARGAALVDLAHIDTDDLLPPPPVSEAVFLVDLAGSVTGALNDPTTWLIEAGGVMAQRLARR
ncbi:hypothetical protein [Microtetraspora sp. NBRC 16547]|uniref:hypothetical protein n=1 Tax=Microtetraspora sp. NBRC 16547 TaxID=3030993 RepID=UPI0024A0740A|nr:hypothetical protein [Microtetraspora sp. NBRC 16547]GLW99284.1 hypothetical protein Misp02_33710 [Microtetraspora sp. NBRC 16547]